jgi:oligopeptide transport system substrate-binding protein
MPTSQPQSRNRLAVPALVLLLLLSACSDTPWNDPYPAAESGQNIFYSSFDERPKHLDPVKSYSANEWAFISQIYEPPLQYHFLKRPYQLVPLSAAAMPEVTKRDAQGRPLPEDSNGAQVAYTDYVITLQPGIRYQPHPAFARDGQGGWRYWPLPDGMIDKVNTLADFPHTDSRELVAADYVYQIKRLAFGPNHSPIAGLMAEHIIGFADYRKETNRAYQVLKTRTGQARPWLDLRNYPLAGVETLGRYRFRIRLNGQYPQFIYWLAMNFFAPMPWEAERFYAQPGMAQRNITLDWYPVGTGPYYLAENNPNLRMVLARNPNFHGEDYPSEGMPGDREDGMLDDAGRPMPFIDKAVYSLEKEAIPRWNKFLQGYYDNSGIASDSFDQAIQFGAGGEASLTGAMRDKGIQLNTAVETSVFYTGFNMKDPVVGGDSRRARLLRRAIAIAMDMEEYITVFQNGRGQAAQGPLPPGIFGYRAGAAGINPYVYRLVNGKLRRRPIEEARALLAKAGYPKGRDPNTGAPLVLYYDTPSAGPGSKSTLDWYRKQLAKLGIQLVIRATDYNRFQDKMLKGTDQIFSWGWNADYPDPENFLFLLYGPNGKVAHQGENAANYANPEFDALFTRMKDLPNGEQRQQVIDRMLAIAQRDGPWIWGFYPKAYSLHHAWYHNAKPHLMANNVLKYKRVDPKLRAARRADWNHPVRWPLLLMVLVLLVSLAPAWIAYRRRERRAAR